MVRVMEMSNSMIKGVAWVNLEGGRFPSTEMGVGLAPGAGSWGESPLKKILFR